MGILVNGRAYDFTQVVVKIIGAKISGVSAVSYAEEQEKQNNYGTGTRPVSRGHGAINASASLTLSMNDVESIRDIAPLGSLLKLPPFDVEVSYMNLQKVVTHVIKNCEFTEDGVDMGEGDKDIKKAFALIPSHVVYR